MPNTPPEIPLVDVMAEVSACCHCEASLPLGPRPVVQVGESAKILIIGQAPGTRVHETGIPWDDPSGERLRDWLMMDKPTFYDDSQVAVLPMGFCYPGRGKSGDLPPSKECAPLWHERLRQYLPHVELTLLIGRYAQEYYLGRSKQTLTERVRHWQDAPPGFFPLPHPSPRNTFWLRRNPWFEAEVIPALRKKLPAIDG